MLDGKTGGAFLHVPHFPSSHSAGGLSPPGLTSALLSESVTPPAPPCDRQGQCLIGMVATCPRSPSVALTWPPQASRGVQEQMVPAPSHEKSQGGQGRGDGNHRVGCGAEPVAHCL